MPGRKRPPDEDEASEAAGDPGERLDLGVRLEPARPPSRVSSSAPAAEGPEMDVRVSDPSLSAIGAAHSGQNLPSRSDSWPQAAQRLIGCRLGWPSQAAARAAAAVLPSWMIRHSGDPPGPEIARIVAPGFAMAAIDPDFAGANPPG